MFAWQLEKTLKEMGVCYAWLARSMKTSRAVIRRLFDATDLAVTLSRISKAAADPGRSVRLELAD